jgi:hypothetical protein
MLSSTANFDWRRPIAVTPDLLRRLHELVVKYAALAARRAVADEGLNPDEITTPEEAQRLYKESGKLVYGSVASSMRRALAVTWSVTLSNDIKRSELTLDEVLAIPNARDALIKDLQVSNGGYGFTCEVSLSPVYKRAANGRVVGPYDVVGHFKDEIIQLLAAHTRNWHTVTKSWFGYTLVLIASLAFVSAITLVVANIFFVPSLSSDRRLAYAMSALWAAGSTIPFIMSPISNWWRRIFPMVEFQIGGGINAAEARRNWRRAAWSIPILIIGMPIITNLISAWLT